VPGALTLDVEALRAVDAGIDGQLAAPAAVEAALRGAGVRAGTRLVALAEEMQPESARVVWTLQYFGHQRAQLLAGRLCGVDRGAGDRRSRADAGRHHGGSFGAVSAGGRGMGARAPR
jgi:3-mercaptopyruvate sulfurtransferase SseA